MSYIEFLFNPDGSIKSRYQPVINYMPDSDSFIIKYSIPGYHAPRQYFKFSTIPDKFSNPYIAEIFKLFSITDSLLYRHPKNKPLIPRQSIINNYFGIIPVHVPDPEEVEAATYNLNLAITLGRKNHSLFYFDSYLEAYKVLHPELKYTKNVIRSIQADFNKAISN